MLNLAQKPVAFREEWAALLRDATVISVQTHVITQDGMLVTDVSSRLGFEENRRHPARYGWTTRSPIKRIFGRSAIASSIGTPNGYFHWILDSLPRVLPSITTPIGATNIDSLLLPQQTPDAVGETLSHVGLSNAAHWRLDDFSAFTCEEVLVTTTGLSGFPHPHTISELRAVIRDSVNVRGADGRDSQESVLYISRKTSRVLKNEEEVLTALGKSFDVTLVHFEDMSFSDQIRAAANASLIVGPHGAGLTNALFAQPGTRVLELFSPHYVNPCFFILSQLNDLEYGYVIGRGLPPAVGFDPAAGRESIEVDPEVVVRTAHLLLETI